MLPIASDLSSFSFYQRGTIAEFNFSGPEQIAGTMRLQEELDETKFVMHQTIESVLEQGEKLDDLVVRSEMLGAQSKRFYVTAKKQNSCCVIM